MDSRRGMTLVEVMVAGAILTLLTVALFQGIILASRIARENAELLQAEGVAWDAVWMAFNEDYDRLRGQCPSVRTVTLSEDMAPELAGYAQAPTLTVSLSRAREIVDGRPVDFVAIEGDVEWGPSGRRRKVSDVQRTFVYRSSLGRARTW